ncbi:uncharacterized protein LOC117137558 [Drosophila mauritiana]|uniref:Uncharacterized protein LOC117137558 n=1 Tax=Drosophila mauritiana TaxID=7226 RepID=A0A6P8JFI2_DROMA|nr:uncharacterized protein LOC117137558 [Drosophila mauritiana]
MYFILRPATCIRINNQHIPTIDEIAPGVILLNKFSGKISVNGTTSTLNGSFVISFSNTTIEIDEQAFTNKYTVHHQPMPAILQTEMTIKNLEEKLSLEFVKELNINNTKTLELLKTTSHTADILMGCVLITGIVIITIRI